MGCGASKTVTRSDRSLQVDRRALRLEKMRSDASGSSAATATGRLSDELILQADQLMQPDRLIVHAEPCRESTSTILR